MSAGNKFESITRQIAEGTARSTLQERASLSHNTKASLPTFYRYVIIETIFDPSIIDDQKISYWKNVLKVSNTQYAKYAPRNSIIAVRVAAPSVSFAEDPIILYPFFPPNISFPCQPGEHVWVAFEAPETTENDLGYWMCRIVEPSYVEDVNHTHPPRAYDPAFVANTAKQLIDKKQIYEFRNGPPNQDANGVRFTSPSASVIKNDKETYDDLLRNTDGSKLVSYEPIPRYKKRPGEQVFEGTNNTLIVMGTDRTGPVAQYDETDKIKGKIPSIPSNDLKSDAGNIDIVVGRGQTKKTLGNVVKNSLGEFELDKHNENLIPSEGDPDLINDRSRVRISQKTKVDSAFGIKSFNEDKKVGINDDDPGGAIVVKTDRIRLIARKDFEIIVTGGSPNDGKYVDGKEDDWAAIVIKTNGDIVLKPSKKGYIKLGDDEADRAILCSDSPAIATGEDVIQKPIFTTGLDTVGTGNPGQGTWAKRVLVK